MAKIIFNLKTEKMPEEIDDYKGSGEAMEPAEWFDTSGSEYEILNEVLDWYSDDNGCLMLKGSFEDEYIDYEEIISILKLFQEEFDVDFNGNFLFEDDDKIEIEAPQFDFDIN